MYGRDLAIALQYFRYPSDQYDKSPWQMDFGAAWNSTERVTDAYGNSMPKIYEMNLGPVAYELLEHGEDYAGTLLYASDMKSWAAKRYESTGKAIRGSST